MDKNLIFAGCSDSKIKLYNVQSGQIDKEIVGHKTPISELVVFENPFDIDNSNIKNRKNFMILSCGTGEEILRLSNPVSPINNGVFLEEKILSDLYNISSPKIQIIKDGNDDSVRLVIPAFNNDKHLIAFVRVRFGN